MLNDFQLAVDMNKEWETVFTTWRGQQTNPALVSSFFLFYFFSKQWLFSSFLFYIYYLIWILFFCELERFDIVLSPFYTIFYWILCVVFLLITLTICLIILSLFSNMIFPPLLLLRHVFLLGFKFSLRVIGLHKGREMLICLLN